MREELPHVSIGEGFHVARGRATLRTSSVAYNHCSMLATAQDGWKLGCLAFTCDTANVPRITDLVGPKK